ncbi:MAG TPA: HNH endonuclease signature motif containing protein, partial [Nocardioidaceae bacterium]|nr:HNH endonuclease signature motif containing protein [Nocardioidaceae bacterium]
DETTADARVDDGDAEESDDPQVISEADVHPAQNDADDPDPEPRPCPTCAGDGQVTGDPSAFVKPPAVDPRRLLPDATLYIHLAEAGLTRDSEGIAEFEGVGPITRSQVIEFLRHTNVRVVPVVDPANQDPVDGYTVPASMAEALHLRNPFCVFPWGTNRSRKKDKDHNKPYVPLASGGPPGQTSMDNLALLTRFSHRLKTHGRWRLRQTSPGVYEWRSPHGYLFCVDETGTYPLGRDRPCRDQRQHE